MSRPITRELKDSVIRKYLQGVGRNENAIDTGLGAGTVTSIIQEFNDNLGEYEPEAIRELAVQLRKAGISPDDCVRGSQVISKMSVLGIDKDKCLAAIEIIQTRSIEKGVTPEKSAEIVSQLFEISKSESMPLNEIPDYVKQKVQEKERLDSEVDVQQRQIQNLKAQADTLLRQNNLTMQNIGSFIALRNELANVGIPETDIEGATNVIRNFSQQGFDANKIVQIASTTMSLQKEVIELSKQCLSFRNTLSPYQHWVPLIQAIIEVGGGAVGPNELRVLVDSIRWRATADKVPTVVAAHAIMGQIQEMYRIIGFEKETKTKQLGLLMLQEKIEDLNEFWAAKLQAIDALTYLAAKGVAKEHVLEFHNFFLANKNRFNLATLVADLERYVSMKQALKQLEENIKTRTYQCKSLLKEVISLLEERKNIENENALMSMRVDSLKKQVRSSTSEHNSPKAKVDSFREQEEKGRIENSPLIIIDPEVTITAFAKSKSGQPGNDAAATAEEISPISNPQSAKAKTTSTVAEVSGVNNKTDTQSSTTETESESTS
jgi:hypothetical protein